MLLTGIKRPNIRPEPKNNPPASPMSDSKPSDSKHSRQPFGQYPRIRMRRNRQEFLMVSFPFGNGGKPGVQCIPQSSDVVSANVTDPFVYA